MTETHELGGASGKLVVKGPAVGQQRQGIGAGLGGAGLNLVRLFAELVLGRGKLLVHVLVCLDQFCHRVDDHRRVALANRAELVVDFLDLAAVLIDIESRASRQLLQTHENLRGAARFRVTLGKRLAAKTGPPHPRGAGRS